LGEKTRAEYSAGAGRVKEGGKKVRRVKTQGNLSIGLGNSSSAQQKKKRERKKHNTTKNTKERFVRCRIEKSKKRAVE